MTILCRSICSASRNNVPCCGTFVFLELPLFPFRHEAYIRDQFLPGECIRYRLTDHAVHALTVLEPEFHLRRMHVHIDILRLHREMQKRKRIFVLHHVALISVLDSFGHESALNVSPVDKIILKIPVSTGNQWFPDKAGDLYHPV